MKKIIFFITLTAMCILVSCGRTVESDSRPQETTVTTTSVTSTKQTTSKTTKATTTTTTTTICNDAPPDSFFMTTVETVEVYDDMTVQRFVTDTNAKLIDEGSRIDTSDIGEKSVKVKFEYEAKTYEKELTYSVVDTTPPIALNQGWDPHTLIDQPFDLKSMVGYVDNYDRDPILSYEGDVDTSEVGFYPIVVTVSDHSGNSTSWNMNVFVTHEKPNNGGSSGERMTFADFKANHPYENVSYGIDVSKWQDNIDYNAVKSEGCDFVIMRMGTYYSSVKMDEFYEQNMENATAAGLKVGVYFYTTDNTEDGAREHARWIVEQLGGRKLDFPVAFDWEEWATFQEYGMNIHDLNQIFEAFCDELEKSGYTGMLYSSRNFLQNFWTNKNDRPVWLAHYVDETNYEGKYAIWQGSSTGQIAGINGCVDMNIRYNDVPLN